MRFGVEQASTDFGLFWLFIGAGNFFTVNLFGELSDVLGRKVQYGIGLDANISEQLLYYVLLVYVCTHVHVYACIYACMYMCT